MKKSTYLFAIALGVSTITFAQNVGINTDGNDPDANTLLHLNNDAGSSLDSALLRIENEKATTGTGVQIENSGTASSKWDIIVPGSSTNLTIKGNGSDHVTIQNDGDVGIGTTNPTATLDVDGDAIFNESGAAKDFRIESDANTHQLYVDGTNNEIGVNTSTPASTIDIQGSMGLKVTTITSATTLDQTHNVVLCNTGTYTVTLPAAASNTGKVYYIKNIDSDGDYFTIDGNSTETIDGDETFELLAYNHAVRIISDGSGWHVINELGKENKDISGCGTYFEFTWKDVTNPKTGLTWMDRNLGAQRVALSEKDDKAYGDLYQWGRPADGHQCRTSSTTAANATDDTPGDALFITEGTTPFDWRVPKNDNLWQGVDGTNNPCPGGYRLPTETELDNEHNSWGFDNAAGAFGSVLKLPMAGYRLYSDGSLLFVDADARGYYWSSSVSGSNARTLYFNSSNAYMTTSFRAAGLSVRCLKD